MGAACIGIRNPAGPDSIVSFMFSFISHSFGQLAFIVSRILMLEIRYPVETSVP